MVAAGSLGPAGGMESGALPPGVYSIVGQSDGGIALSAYKIVEGEVVPDSPGPLPLVAPASDWALARTILARRFPVATPVPGANVVPDGVPAGVVPPPSPAAMPAPLAVRPTDADPVTTTRQVASVRPGDLGRIDQYDATGTLQPVPFADIYLIRSGELVATLKADADGQFRLPLTLQPGVHTVVSIGTPENSSEPGASVTGLNVAASVDENAVINEQGDEEEAVAMRPVVFRRVVKQGPAFSVTQAPGSDVVLALGEGPEPGPPGFIPPGPGFPGGGGFGGGAGGVGGGGAGVGGGGLLIPALIGAGIGAALADDDDDDDDDPPGFNRRNPRAQSPQGPPFTPPGPPPVVPPAGP
ncbi:hypothetical protein [Alienimonas sp. DA493]|uniref:hypothetical protein n=1 Tax=Alienimonas sp. DA493 TaxID=3373605 RepID=UPI0037552115